MMKANSAKIAVAKDSFTSGVLILTGSILLFVFGVLGLIGGPASGLDTAADVVLEIVCLALMAFGIWLIARGAKRKKFLKLSKEYAARLAADPYRSIDQLAAAKGVTTVTARDNLQKMISRGYFNDAYIDYHRNSLVFVQEDAPSMPGVTKLQTAPDLEYVSVTCHGCGATNRVHKGSAGECEFCGNALTSK